MLPLIYPSEMRFNDESRVNVDTPEKITEVVQQFESLLIEQLLRSMRTAESGNWMGTEDKSSESLIEYAEQEFSRVISRNGGLGLAKLLTDGLSEKRILGE